MALVKPFRAWHYHPEKVAIERVVAPPYDVISESYRHELYKRDPYNVIRLILGQPKAGETFEDREYQKARDYLNQWTQAQILSCESEDGFYLYEMDYHHPFLNKLLSRLAIFALLKLEPFEQKVIFPHERTHASPKVDRGKLLRATQANFSPVFTLYEDPTKILDDIRKSCDSRTPLFDFVDDQKIRHRLWVIREKKEMDWIAAQFDRKRIFIADGHHRYETALNYAAEMRSGFISRTPPSSPFFPLPSPFHLKGEGRKKKDEGESWEYVMSTFVRFNDPGLLIFPIHRVVLKSVPIDRETFLEGLKKHFILHSVSRSVLEKVSEGAIMEGFGLAFSETECYLLELKDHTRARQDMPQGKPERWYELDMNLISFLILEPLLKMNDTLLERSIFYTPSVDEAFGKLKTGEASCAFFIRPITAHVIKEICESGELMPQKSTYFYPKFPSGLLMYRY